jgi:hypothetical protein
MKSKLKIDDNWSILTYFYNKEDVTNKIKEVIVEWPNRVEERFKVKWIEETSNVHDMGHVYPVDHYVGYITVKYNNFKIDIDIRDLVITKVFK